MATSIQAVLALAIGLLASANSSAQGLPKDAYFPTHLDSPKTLMFARNWYNYKAARDFISAVDEINAAEDTRISVLSAGVDFSPEIKKSVADSQSQKNLPQWPYLKLADSLPKTTHVKPEHMTESMDDWFQDIYEFFYTGGSTLSAVEWRDPFMTKFYAPASFKGGQPSRREMQIAIKKSAQVRAEFAKRVDLNPKFLIQYEKLNPANDFQGGNFEAYPGDVIVAGSRTSGTPIETLLKGTRYENRVISLETRWLQIAHVDETLNYIPDRSANCGFRIVVPDAVEGGKLFLKLKKQDLDAVPEDYKFIGDNGGLPYDGQSIVEANERLSGGASHDPQDEAHVKLFALNNAHAQTQIERELAKFISAYQKLVPACKGAMEIVRLPTVLQCFSAFTSDYAGLLSKPDFSWCKSLIPNPVNFVSMGTHTLVPKQFFTDLEAGVARELGQHTKIHWIDTVLYNSSSGNAHCASNVIRAGRW